MGSCCGGRRVRRLHCAARSRGPVGKLTSLAFGSLRSNSADESVHERAARGAASPALLVATEIAPAGYRPPRVQPLSLFAANTKAGAAKVRSGRSEGASSALRSTGIVARARSALRELTCRRLFERSAAKQAKRVRRRATRPRTGRQSERQRRPPKRSPPACPDAPLPPHPPQSTRESSSTLTAARNAASTHRTHPETPPHQSSRSTHAHALQHIQTRHSIRRSCDCRR